MKRYIPLLVALLALVLVALAEVTINRERLEQDRVYTVAEVRAELAHDPQTWVGRTLLVRGIAITPPCMLKPSATVVFCEPLRFALIDPDPAAAPHRLDVTWEAPATLLTVLRRLPFVGSIVPPPQMVRLDVVAVYRVRLRALAGTSCGVGCYEAVLLDASPASL